MHVHLLKQPMKEVTNSRAIASLCLSLTGVGPLVVVTGHFGAHDEHSVLERERESE